MNEDLKKDAPGNQKNHYAGAIQPIDYIFSNDLDALSANVLKYVVRYKHKNGLEDLKKAKWYLQWLKKRISDSPYAKCLSAEEFVVSQELNNDQANIAKTLEQYMFHLDEYYYCVEHDVNNLQEVKTEIGEMFDTIEQSITNLMREYD